MINGVIFDVDGVLLNSMPIWENLGELYLRELGIEAEKDLGKKLFTLSMEEAAEYLGIPKGTLYMKLSEGSIPATKPGKRYCLYRDELDKWLESSRKNPVPLSDEELSESLSSSHRRKPTPRNW